MSHFLLGAGVLTVMFAACGPAEALPLHVRDSAPAAEAIVYGRNVQYLVRFDGWVDHGASQMDITECGKIVEPLVPTRDSEPMFWRPRPRHCPRVNTNSIGMRNQFQTAISRMDSSRSRSRSDFGPRLSPSSGAQ
jgi:hypothetical protein